MQEKTRIKQLRYLLEAGFQTFEAEWLAAIPFRNNRIIRTLIKKRQALQAKRTREANREGWNIPLRQKIWEERTRRMYQKRGWIAEHDHSTGHGPRAGEPNVFALYRHYARNYYYTPGESWRPPGDENITSIKWKLDMGQILLMRARRASQQGDRDTLRATIEELDKNIQSTSGLRQQQLKAAKEKLLRTVGWR